MEFMELNVDTQVVTQGKNRRKEWGKGKSLLCKVGVVLHSKISVGSQCGSKEGEGEGVEGRVEMVRRSRVEEGAER